MRIRFTILLLLISVLTWAQTPVSTRQLRFYPVNSASIDTSAIAGNSGRMWYDFTTNQFRINKNGTNSSIGAGGGGGAVSSVFGRTGVVTAQTGDYTPLQVGAWALAGTSTLTNDAIIAAGSNDVTYNFSSSQFNVNADGANLNVGFGDAGLSGSTTGSNIYLFNSGTDGTSYMEGRGAGGVVLISRTNAGAPNFQLFFNTSGAKFQDNRAGAAAVGLEYSADYSANIITNTSSIPDVGTVTTMISTLSPVSSVFGRTGAVVAATNDYTPAQVGAWGLTGSSTITTPTLVGNPYFSGNTLFGNTAETITANTKIDVRGIGTTTNTSFRIANSANTSRFVILDNGSLTATGVAEGSGGAGFSWSSTFTAGGDNRMHTLLSGALTHSSTTNRNLSVVDNIVGIGTGATGQFLYGYRNRGNFTVNHTTATLIGFDWSPTLAGSQTPTHLAWRNTVGQLLFGGTTITAGSVLADFQSTTQGILLPRVTNAAAVTTPVNGMMAYDAATAKTITYQNGAWYNVIPQGLITATGTAVLVGGTVVVNTALVTANSRILLTTQLNGGTVGYPHITARTAATSFTITSTSGTDTSTVGWVIVEPY